MAWALLLAAAVLEVVWAVALKQRRGGLARRRGTGDRGPEPRPRVVGLRVAET